MTPIESLKSAEVAMIRQIHSVAGAVSRVGTDSLESALATLHGEVESARIRLQAGVQQMARQIQDLAAFAAGIVAMDVCGIVELEQAEDDRIARLTREEVGKELEAHGIDTTAAQKKVREALDRQKTNGEHTAAVEASGGGQPALPRSEVFEALNGSLDPAEEDRRNRTPDSELDSSELEDQPEEVERNRQMVEMESVPAVVDGSPAFDYDADSEPFLGVGTGVEAAVPDVPQPGKNGRQRKAKKGK